MSAGSDSSKVVEGVDANALDALLEGKKDVCVACGGGLVSAHVEPMSESEMFAEPPSNEQAMKREFEAHTRAYLDAMEKKMRSLGVDPSDDAEDDEPEKMTVEQRTQFQQQMGAWAQEHHSTLCCPKRHRNVWLMVLA